MGPPAVDDGPTSTLPHTLFCLLLLWLMVLNDASAHPVRWLKRLNLLCFALALFLLLLLYRTGEHPAAQLCSLTDKDLMVKRKNEGDKKDLTCEIFQALLYSSCSHSFVRYFYVCISMNRIKRGKEMCQSLTFYFFFVYLFISTFFLQLV